MAEEIVYKGKRGGLHWVEVKSIEDAVDSSDAPCCQLPKE